MTKFDGIRMKDLVRVEDPDGAGGVTLHFEGGASMSVRAEGGALVSESRPE